MPNDLGVFVAAEVSRAETDFQAFRTRSLNLVGVSGGLVTLVAALLGIATASSTVRLPAGARVTAGFAIFSFVASAICALIINSPADVTLSDTADLKDIINSDWDEDGWDKEVALVLVNYLESLRINNATSAEWLMASIGFQIGAVTLLAVTALIIVA